MPFVKGHGQSAIPNTTSYFRVVRKKRSCWRARSCGGCANAIRSSVSITATRFANFLESVEAQEVLLQQRLTDAESRRLRTPVSGPQPVEATVGGVDVKDRDVRVCRNARAHMQAKGAFVRRM